MKKSLAIFIFAIFLGVFTQTHTLFASSLISQSCPTGYYWDQLECKSIYLDCINKTGAVWKGNNSCECGYGYSTLYFGYIAPNVHNSYFQFGCYINPTPQPEPVIYCDINKQYSFGVSPYIKQCVCPTNSTMTETSALPGTHQFICTSNYTPKPLPLPPTVCETDKVLVFYGYGLGCTCPYPTIETKVDGVMHGYNFMCVTPQPKIYCWDGSFVNPQSQCPSRSYCNYGQVWNGYTCTSPWYDNNWNNDGYYYYPTNQYEYLYDTTWYDYSFDSYYPY